MQLANNLNNHHLPPFLLHFSNGCTVPIQFTKLKCRMLNPFHVALPFRIKTGLDFKRADFTLQLHCWEGSKNKAASSSGKPSTRYRCCFSPSPRKPLNATALPSSVHIQHYTLQKGPNATSNQKHAEKLCVRFLPH